MFRFRRLYLLVLLLATVTPAQQATRWLTILHVNDLHARLLPDLDGRGGFAHLATAIERERAGSKSCLLLNGGDFVQGSPVSTLFQGLPVFEIANLFRIDVATLGNHDFDYGWQMVPRYLRTARFPVVLANVVNDQGRLLTGRAYAIKKVNGIRVAVIGAVMGNLLSYATPERMGPWRALPATESVRKYAAQVRDRADLIVLLAHLELPEQSEMLSQAPEVGVVIGGHVHGALPAPEEFEGRVLVRAASYGRELGRLDLEMDVPAKKVVSWKWKRILVDAKTTPPAKDVGARVSKWEARVSEIVDVPIGEARRDIAAANLKRLMERAMTDETGADLAFMNPGGIRDRLPKGRLLARHVWNIMPFDNTVVVGKFRGSQLPASVTAGRSINPSREYTLAVSDFTAINQKEQMGTTGLVFPKTGPLLRDMLIQWIKKRKIVE